MASDIDRREHWYQEAQRWKQKYEDLVARQASAPEPNVRGKLDDIGKSHIKQSAGRASVAALAVGLWYAVLREADYLGSKGLLTNEHVVQAHQLLMGAFVAWWHKTFSGDTHGG